MRVGISLRPRTPASAVIPYLSFVDYLLVMTVEPGFGGQKFMTDMMPKLKELRAIAPHLDIGVDGGLDLETIHVAAAAGANVIVAGSAIFRAKDPAGVIVGLRKSVQDGGFCSEYP